MNKSTPTPRTDVVSRMPYADGQDWIDLAHELERDLTAVTEQRDRLAESLRKFIGDALFCSHADTAKTVSPPQQVDDNGDALTMPYTNKHGKNVNMKKQTQPHRGGKWEKQDGGIKEVFADLNYREINAACDRFLADREPNFAARETKRKLATVGRNFKGGKLI